MGELVNDFLTTLWSWLEAISQSASGALDTIRLVDPSIRTLLAGIAVMLQNFVITGLFIPASTVVFLTASTIAGPAEGVLLAAAIGIGGLIGQTASYCLGRWVRSSDRLACWYPRPVGPAITGAQRFLERQGGPAILGSRFVPFLRIIMPFAVGSSGFPFLKFLAWSAASSVTWSVIYVYAFALISAPLRDKSDSPLVSIGLALLGFVAFSAAYAVQYFVERERQRADSATPGTFAKGAQ